MAFTQIDSYIHIHTKKTRNISTWTWWKKCRDPSPSVPSLQRWKVKCRRIFCTVNTTAEGHWLCLAQSLSLALSLFRFAFYTDTTYKIQIKSYNISRIRFFFYLVCFSDAETANTHTHSHLWVNALLKTTVTHAQTAMCTVHTGSHCSRKSINQMPLVNFLYFDNSIRSVKQL